MPRSKLVPLGRARIDLVPRYNGKSVSPSTIWRWIHRGLEGKDGERIYLEVTYCGSRPYVSREAIDEFNAAITEARLARHRQSDAQDADVTPDELAAAGLR